MSSATIELQGPSQTIYLVERGVIDDRSIAAFRMGQCHALALAMAARLGWDLVAVVAADGTWNHICARRPDGYLVDITGARPPGEVTADPPGSTIVTADDADIDRLVAEEEWARPDLDAAESFLVPVLSLAEGEPRTPSIMRVIQQIGDVELRFVWEGFEFIAIYIRRSQEDISQWAPYDSLRLPIDPIRNAYVIDFRPPVFEALVDEWMIGHEYEFPLHTWH